MDGHVFALLLLGREQAAQTDRQTETDLMLLLPGHLQQKPSFTKTVATDFKNIREKMEMIITSLHLSMILLHANC